MNTNPASFYEHPDFEGGALRLSRGSSIADLRGHMLFWPVTWNDVISSVQAAEGGGHTILYQKSNYWGSEVWIASGTYIHNLSWRAFDNQASSISVVY